MKILRLLSIWFALSLCLTACDDDDNNEVPGNGSTPTVPQVAVSFDKEEMTVLKNAGEVQLPVVLAEAAEGPVRLTVAVKEQTDGTAEEGIDFDLKEKVITIAKGSTIGYVNLMLYDNSKADSDKSFVLEIKNVYDYGKAADTKQNCTVRIVSNAFAEFQYANRETAEAAGTFQIPLLISGEIKTATTLTVRVKEGGTALEGTHFTIPNPQITLAPGATAANVEIALIDDKDANEDRWFDLEIVEIQGSNAIIGSLNICRLTIVSEEVAKAVAFEKTAYSVEEGEEIRIPVLLDKAPAIGEDKVLVTISLKSNGSAIEGTDFTIENKVLEFAPGQKVEDIVIHTIPNDQLDADRSFELYIKAAAGANLSTPDACTVTIQNNDFPVFAQESYSVEEAMGKFTIPFTLTEAPTSDITLNVVCEPIDNSAIEGTHYTLETSEVVVKAGETTGNIVLNIGHTSEWGNTPVFKTTVTGMNGINWDITPSPVTTELQQSTYRKLLGQWQLTSKFGVTSATVSLSCETDANFNKILSMKGIYAENREDTFHLTFDPKTHAIQVILGENVTPTSSVKFGRWPDAATAPVPVSLSADLNTLTWAEVGYLGGYFYNSSNELSWNYFMQDVVMKKK